MVKDIKLSKFRAKLSQNAVQKQTKLIFRRKKKRIKKHYNFFAKVRLTLKSLFWPKPQNRKEKGGREREVRLNVSLKLPKKRRIKFGVQKEMQEI